MTDNVILFPVQSRAAVPAKSDDVFVAHRPDGMELRPGDRARLNTAGGRVHTGTIISMGSVITGVQTYDFIGDDGIARPASALYLEYDGYYGRNFAAEGSAA